MPYEYLQRISYLEMREAYCDEQSLSKDFERAKSALTHG
jgi:hypothetical protein